MASEGMNPNDIVVAPERRAELDRFAVAEITRLRGTAGTDKCARTALEVADGLVEACRTGLFDDLLDEDELRWVMMTLSTKLAAMAMWHPDDWAGIAVDVAVYWEDPT